MNLGTTADNLLSGRNNGLEDAARLCECEADACVGDIVPGDDIGRREANARAGALLTAAADIRALITHR